MPPTRKPFKALVLMDSGMGGLSVLQQLQALPAWQALAQTGALPPVHYVADTAFLPYGPKPLPQLQSRLSTLMHTFAQHWEGALVGLCCNTASVALCLSPWASTSPTAAHYPLTLLDIITPTCHGVAQQLNASVAQRPAPYALGLLATEATVNSGCFPALLQQEGLTLQTPFQAIACSGLAQSIEAEADWPPPETLLPQLLAPLLPSPPADGLILGCTHYQFVAPLLRKLLPHAPLFSQAQLMAQALVAALSQAPNAVPPAPSSSFSPPIQLWATAAPQAFQAKAQRLGFAFEGPQALPPVALLAVE